MKIEIENLFKSYGTVKALINCHLTIFPKEIFALLGPNGAGKTSLVKSLLSLIPFEKGTIKVNDTLLKGEEAFTLVRENISYLPEKYTFFPYYTVESTLLFLLRMNLGQKKMSKEEERELLLKNLSKGGIVDLRERRIKTLSKGQLQRVGLVGLLMGDLASSPRLFILDEPFSGLDPIGIRDLKLLLNELKNDGHTLFLNSHILSEIEQIADRVAILNKGEVIAQGKIKDLLKPPYQKLEDYFISKVESN